MMEKIITRTMTGFCLGLLVFYAYELATINPAPVWTPPTLGRCIIVAGDLWCW